MTDQFTVDGIFQARVSSKRESKAGIFLTVEIPADDYSPALAQLRAGSLLKMGWQELVDVSVQPIEAEPTSSEALRAASQEVHKTLAPLREALKPKKRFEDYPLSAQCAMRCNEAQFHAFLNTLYGSFTRVITDPATFVRGKLRIASRKEIDTNAVAGYEWIEMERSYQNWLTDQKYAGARR